MTLTDEEWQAFISEQNGVMDDVETDLAAALEGNRLALLRLAARGTIPVSEADGLYQALREALLRAQDRLNAHGRRLVQMRGAGEL